MASLGPPLTKANPPRLSETTSKPAKRSKGFVLLLVIDEAQADGQESIARVARDFDVAAVGDLKDEIHTVCRQACNQLVAKAKRAGCDAEAVG